MTVQTREVDASGCYALHPRPHTPRADPEIRGHPLDPFAVEHHPPESAVNPLDSSDSPGQTIHREQPLKPVAFRGLAGNQRDLDALPA